MAYTVYIDNLWHLFTCSYEIYKKLIQKVIQIEIKITK